MAYVVLALVLLGLLAWSARINLRRWRCRQRARQVNAAVAARRHAQPRHTSRHAL